MALLVPSELKHNINLSKEIEHKVDINLDSGTIAIIASTLFILGLIFIYKKK